MSNLEITQIRKASAGEWDQHWMNCAYATFFQSREWTEVWEAYSEGELMAHAEHVTFSDGKEAVLPASMAKMYKGWKKKYIMSAAGTFGGWISKDQMAERHVKNLFNYLSDKNKNVQWRVNPYDENLKNLSFKATREDTTSVLPLTTDFEEIFQRWSKGHKRAVKKAEKEGVKISLATEEDNWKAYYQIYLKSLDRWGDKATSSYTWELFKKLFERKSPDIKLWLASCEGKLLAGALCLYARKHVVYWHGAADDAYFHMRPVHYLFQEAIKDACRKGYQWFDFNPSGGHEGVRKFKRGFATEEKPYFIVEQYNQVSKNMRRVHWVIGRIKRKMNVS